MPLEYTFWLMPAEPVKSKLRALIHDFAQEFQAPEFDPHVTMYWGKSNEDEARAAAKKIAGQFRPVKLEAEKLDQSDEFTKTFFIQFVASEYASRMCEAMRKDFATPSEYILNPHLSLLYERIPEEIRKGLCRRPILPKESYLFDAIAAIEFEAPWSGKYRVLDEYPLYGE